MHVYIYVILSLSIVDNKLTKEKNKKIKKEK